jgi:hypothetical protein
MDPVQHYLVGSQKTHQLITPPQRQPHHYHLKPQRLVHIHLITRHLHQEVVKVVKVVIFNHLLPHRLLVGMEQHLRLLRAPVLLVSLINQLTRLDPHRHCHHVEVLMFYLKIKFYPLILLHVIYKGFFDWVFFLFVVVIFWFKKVEKKQHFLGLFFTISKFVAHFLSHNLFVNIVQR